MLHLFTFQVQDRRFKVYKSSDGFFCISQFIFDGDDFSWQLRYSSPDIVDFNQFLDQFGMTLYPKTFEL